MFFLQHVHAVSRAGQAHHVLLQVPRGRLISARYIVLHTAMHAATLFAIVCTDATTAQAQKPRALRVYSLDVSSPAPAWQLCSPCESEGATCAYPLPREDAACADANGKVWQHLPPPVTSPLSQLEWHNSLLCKIPYRENELKACKLHESLQNGTPAPAPRSLAAQVSATLPTAHCRGNSKLCTTCACLLVLQGVIVEDAGLVICFHVASLHG